MTGTSEIIDSIIDFGAATTNLAIDQVENAFTAFTRPGDAIDHVKDTMQNLSAAMNTSTSKHKTTKHETAEHHAAEHKTAEHKAKPHLTKTHPTKS